MEINYWAVLVCAVLSMVVGYAWFGPLFGKKWLEIIGATAMDEAKRKDMQKKAMPLYAVQFLLTLIQVWVLAYAIMAAGWQGSSGLILALWAWAAFVVPIIAGSSMWNNDSAKISWARFFIQAGYQLVMFAIYGAILGNWQ